MASAVGPLIYFCNLGDPNGVERREVIPGPQIYTIDTIDTRVAITQAMCCHCVVIVSSLPLVSSLCCRLHTK